MRSSSQEVRLHPPLNRRPTPRRGEIRLTPRQVDRIQNQPGTARLQRSHGQAHPREDIKKQLRRPIPTRRLPTWTIEHGRVGEGHGQVG